MDISLNKTTAVSAILTLKFGKADYEPQLTKAIKNFMQKAQMPGFRPGKVPFGMAQKVYGPQAKMETINKLLSDSLFGYIREQKLSILGEPLANEEQEPQDIERQDDFEFSFDLALVPEFKVELTSKDKIAYYDIAVADEQVEAQVKALAGQAGHAESVEAYAEGDVVKGSLTELGTDGQPLEDGVSVEQASIYPQYIKSAAQKKLFAKAKKGATVTFCPAEAYENETQLASLLNVKKEELDAHKGNFALQISEISRFVPAELNQDFFDRIYGKDAVKTEEEFRARVKEQIARQYEADSNYRFLLDVRSYAEAKVGELELPAALLRRIMIANNKDKDEKYVDDNFERSLAELKWHLIKEKLAEAQGIKVEDADVKAMAIEAARYQFAQYGMNNLPDEYLEQYAQSMLKDQNQVNGLVERAIDNKLGAALKNVVTLQRKQVTVEEFGHLFDEAAATETNAAKPKKAAAKKTTRKAAAETK